MQTAPGLVDIYCVGCLPALVRMEPENIVGLVLVNPSSKSKFVPAGTTVAALSVVEVDNSGEKVIHAVQNALSEKEKIEKVIEELEIERMGFPTDKKKLLLNLVKNILKHLLNMMPMSAEPNWFTMKLR